MKDFKLALGCKLSLGLAAAACFGQQAISAPTPQPFRATLNIVEQVTPATKCYLTGTVVGAGFATDMGKVTAKSQDCINPISATSFWFSSQQPLEILAANGDLLRVCYSGRSAQGTMATLTDGTYTIIGGSGTFQGATGSGVLQGLEDLSGGFAVPAPGQMQLNGTIAYGSPSNKNKPNCSGLPGQQE